MRRHCGRRGAPLPDFVGELVGVPCGGLRVVGAPLQDALRDLLPVLDAAVLGRAVGNVTEGRVENRVELVAPTGVEFGERAVCRDDRCRVGISAGASTPDWMIQSVVERLREIADSLNADWDFGIAD